MTALADQLGIDKHNIMDVSVSDLAVRAAIAEMEVIKCTTEWLKTEGIRVNAFERKGEKVGRLDEQPTVTRSLVTRSKTTIVATHFPVKFDEDEQLSMFSEIRGMRESEQALSKRSNI